MRSEEFKKFKTVLFGAIYSAGLRYEVQDALENQKRHLEIRLLL